MFGVIALGASIVSSLLGASAQSKANKQNKKAAKNALNINNRDISIRALQERIASALEAREYSQDAADAASSVTASAAAGNVGGMTVDILLQDIENQRRLGLTRIGRQRDVNLGVLDRERTGALQSSRNMARQTSAPNPFAVGLRILGDVAAYGADRERSRSTTDPER